MRVKEVNVPTQEVKKILKRHKLNTLIFGISYFLLLCAFYTLMRKFGEKNNMEFLFGELYLLLSLITYFSLSCLNKYILKTSFDELIKKEMENEIIKK